MMYKKDGDIMIKKEKVKLMTHLAIYEQNEGKEDMKTNEYYKSNYVSFQNFKRRLGVTIALILIFGGHFSIVFMNNLYEMEQLDYMKYGSVYLIIWLVAMVVYTIIGTMKYSKKYEKAKARIDDYKAILNRLNKLS